MTVIGDEVPRLKDEEVLPLMHTLQLEGSSISTRSNSSTGSDSKGHAAPLKQRLKLLLKGFSHELLAIALVYFVQGILRLSSLAVTFFLKDNLKMEPTQMALVETITALPWTVKPLYGFITDSFPILGMRRRPYLILSGLLGSLAWLCMAGFANSEGTTIAFITAAALSTAFSDVVADSIVVQLARASPGATEGALQSMCWSAHAFGRVITAYLSGWLVGQVGPRPVFVATASFPLIVCASSCLIQESGKQSTVQTCDPEGLKFDSRESRTGEVGAHADATVCDQSDVAFSCCTSVAAGKQGLTEPQQADLHSSQAALPGQSSAEVLWARLQPAQSSLQHHLHLKHRSGGSAHVTPGVTPKASSAGPGAAAGSAGNPFSRLAAAAASDGVAVQGADAAGLPAGSGSGGTGKHKHRICLQEAWVNMAGSVKLFWNAIKQPHMLRPVVFLFLFQAMPQPDSAMFYFKTNKLGFDAEFFGRVKLVAALADLAGLAVYNAFLKSARLRPMMLWGALLGCAVGLTPLLLVEGINRQMGISDRLFAMVDSALLASIGQVLMMPTLVLSARLCPEGVEATLYASLMSLNNAAVGVSSLWGALMMKLFGITSSNFEHLTALLLTCNLMSLLPLPLVGWVPDTSPKEAAAAAAADAGELQGLVAEKSEAGAGSSSLRDMELGTPVGGRV